MMKRENAMKTLHNIFARPKYYFIFPVVVFSLFGVSLIQVGCPVCSGTGSIAFSIGMENVRIVSMEPRIISASQDACTSYVVVKSEPVITVSNTGAVEASGYLKLNLIDLTNGATLVSRHLAVTVPANGMAVLKADNFAFAWVSLDFPPENMTIHPEVVNEQVPCLICEGKGLVSLSSYPLTKSYKDTFVSSIRSQSEYGPEDWIMLNGHRVEIGSKEWMDWMELN